jgi:hypothetical protein
MLALRLLACRWKFRAGVAAGSVSQQGDDGMTESAVSAIMLQMVAHT